MISCKITIGNAFFPVSVDFYLSDIFAGEGGGGGGGGVMGVGPSVLM